MQDKAIESAQNNRVKDPSSPVFSCMLSQWNAKLVDSDETDLSSNIETYDVFGYERFLDCTKKQSECFKFSTGINKKDLHQMMRLCQRRNWC